MHKMWWWGGEPGWSGCSRRCDKVLPPQGAPAEVGEVFLARDAYLIMRNTVSTYNRVVKPEDRVL